MQKRTDLDCCNLMTLETWWRPRSSVWCGWAYLYRNISHCMSSMHLFVGKINVVCLLKLSDILSDCLKTVCLANLLNQKIKIPWRMMGGSGSKCWVRDTHAELSFLFSHGAKLSCFLNYLSVLYFRCRRKSRFKMFLLFRKSSSI
jgi:hypothetical protein